MRATREHSLVGLGANSVVRAFIGMLVPPAADMLEDLRGDADLHALPVRWLMPEGLHVTLAFLGESPADQLSEAWPGVVAAVAAQRSFRLSLQAPEPFPDPQRPKLITAPVAGDHAALQALHAQVTEALLDAGYALEDRPFRPHVSLGRLRPPLLRGQAAAIGAALRSRVWSGTASFPVSTVAVMRSDLFPDGARYTVLAEAPLGGR